MRCPLLRRLELITNYQIEIQVLTALIAVIEMRVLDSMLWEIIAATTSLGGAIITVILIFTWRKRVKQTVATMEAISLFFDEYYVGSFVILILSIVLVLFWGIVWGFAVLLTQPFVLLNPVFSVFAWIFYVIVWLWTTQGQDIVAFLIDQLTVRSHQRDGTYHHGRHCVILV